MFSHYSQNRFDQSSNKGFSSPRTQEQVAEFLAQGFLSEYNSCKACPQEVICGAVISPLFKDGFIDRATASMAKGHGIHVGSDRQSACPKKLVETAIANVTEGTFWVATDDVLNSDKGLQVGQALMNSVADLQSRLQGGQQI